MKPFSSGMKLKRNFEQTVGIIVHVCIWTYIFSSPLLNVRRGEPIDWGSYLQRLYFPISMCVVFYINYFYLIPHLLFGNKRYRRFVVLNVVLIIALMLSRDLYVALMPPPEMLPDVHRPIDEAEHEEPSFLMRCLFYLRNFVSQAFLAVLAVMVRLSVQWRKADKARQEAELGRTEAELKNLKNQINPHFLLNTLNNIYALTAFDAEKAQRAIEQLSRMLRYVLYENQKNLVDLKKEVEFIRTYISLMRIRVSDDVRIDLRVDVPDDASISIAPLIFISLVENAFKHGISTTGDSFIEISIRLADDHLIFSCRNSNFPKTASDKSPGGIGLQQVRSRLEHSYAGHYTWQYGEEPDGGVYCSRIDIDLRG